MSGWSRQLSEGGGPVLSGDCEILTASLLQTSPPTNVDQGTTGQSLLTQSRALLCEDRERVWSSCLALDWAPAQDPQVQKTGSAPSGYLCYSGERTGSRGSSQGTWRSEANVIFIQPREAFRFHEAGKHFKAATSPLAVSPTPSSSPEPSSLSPL